MSWWVAAEAQRREDIGQLRSSMVAGWVGEQVRGVGLEILLGRESRPDAQDLC